jgi:D-aminopeptidase
VILATDAPLSSRQLSRLAKRGSGFRRAGADTSHGSGDYFIAFSTTYRQRILASLAADLAVFVEEESAHCCSGPQIRWRSHLNSFFRAQTMRGRTIESCLPCRWTGSSRFWRITDFILLRGEVSSGETP